MKPANFTTSITVEKTAIEVFNAINNVKAWWQGEILGNNENIGDEFSYRMRDLHYSRQRVIELVPAKKIVWLVIDSKLGTTNSSSEWTGTKIVFELKEINNKTEFRFTHIGLVPAFECYEGCSWGWEGLVQQSLLSLMTTGEGKNVFG